MPLKQKLTKEELNALRAVRRGSPLSGAILECLWSRLKEIDRFLSRHPRRPSNAARTATLRAIAYEMYRSKKPVGEWSSDNWHEARHNGYRGKSGCLLPLIALELYNVSLRGWYHREISTPRSKLAFAIFGKSAVERELKKMFDALESMGYAVRTRKPEFQRIVADLMLFAGVPSLNSLDDEILNAYVEATKTKTNRKLMGTISNGLTALGIISKPIYFSLRAPGLKALCRSYRGNKVSAEWYDWCVRWHSTTTRARADTCFYALMVAGKWLRRFHPKVRRPDQWTRPIAVEYVAFVDRMRSGQLDDKPRPNITNFGDPLSYHTRVGYLMALRAFMHECEDWGWCDLRINPMRALRTPEKWMKARTKKPKVIDDAFWVKLTWAALNLTVDDIPASTFGLVYPAELFRALGCTWIYAGLRSADIGRLRVGCISLQSIPAEIDLVSQTVVPALEQYCLEVPVNKTSDAYVKPVDKNLAFAILDWEKVRPDQPLLLDSKTGERVSILFCYRGRAVGKSILNDAIIPILAKKAGLPLRDVMGALTSHRARATMSSKLYNVDEGLSPYEAMAWLGHRHFSSTQHYLDLTPTKLMKAFNKANREFSSTHMVEALVDLQALHDGRSSEGLAAINYNLGHGFCQNAFFAKCKHRMACAKCDFYVPKESEKGNILMAREDLARMLVEIPLTKAEREAVEGDEAALGRLISNLNGKRMPDGKVRSAPKTGVA